MCAPNKALGWRRGYAREKPVDTGRDGATETPARRRRSPSPGKYTEEARDMQEPFQVKMYVEDDERRIEIWSETVYAHGVVGDHQWSALVPERVNSMRFPSSSRIAQHPAFLDIPAVQDFIREGTYPDVYDDRIGVGPRNPGG